MAAIRPVLVLGGRGFLGVHVVRAALAAGRSVVVASRASDWPTAAGLAAVPCTRLDARREADVAALLDRVRPDAVVLTAAVSRIDAAERDADSAVRLNAELPGVVGAWTRAHGARLVHVSTDLVFGGEPPRAAGYREDDPVDPRSTYGATKARGEDEALAADPSACVVRLPLLCGESFGRGLGATDALLAALARGERPTLFTDEWRTPLDVATAAQALVELTEPPTRALVGRLHVAGERRLDRHALGLELLAAAGVADPAARVTAGTRAAAGLGSRPRDVSLDATRARARLVTLSRSGALASRSRALAWCLVLLACCVSACATADADTLPRRRATAPFVETIGFRFEARAYELPLERLVALRAPAVLPPGAVAARIDDSGACAALDALVANGGGDVERVETRSDGLRAADERVRFAFAPATSPVLSGTTLDVSARVGTTWQDHDLAFELALGANDPANGGATRLRLVGSTEMPSDLWLFLAARARDANAPRAWAVFVRAVRVGPPTGDA